MQRFRASAVAALMPGNWLSWMPKLFVRLALMRAPERPPGTAPGQPLARRLTPLAQPARRTAWAQEMLAGRSVAAIDGYRSCPVATSPCRLGVVQAAAYINHTADGSYETPRWLELLTSTTGLDGNDPERLLRTRQLARYELECRSAVRSCSNWRTSRMALVLVDGSLTLIRRHAAPTLRTCYVQAVQACLHVRRRHPWWGHRPLLCPRSDAHALLLDVRRHD